MQINVDVIYYIKSAIIFPIMQKQATIKNQHKTNTDLYDLSDLQEQRKILYQFIPQLQNQNVQEQNIDQKEQKIGIMKKLSQNQNKNDKNNNGCLEVGFARVKRILKTCMSAPCSDPSDQSFGFVNILHTALKANQIFTLQMYLKNFKFQQIPQLKQKYLKRMEAALNKIRLLIQDQLADQQTKLSAISAIKQVQSLYSGVQSKYKTFSLTIQTQTDALLIMMISLYLVFQKDYIPYKRTILKKIFVELGGNTFNNNIQVLRYLENQTKEMKDLKFINQLDLTPQVINCLSKFRNEDNKNEIDNIFLVKVSQSKQRRRVINLLISGFLSEDVDKKEQWNQLLGCMPDSQVYGLQWDSDTIKRLIKFFAISVKDLILNKQNYKDIVMKDNPFIPAFQVAVKTGQYLAHIIHELFPFQFVNIIGYSLGSELIRSFLQKTFQLNGGKRMNKVVMMGGVTDTGQFEATLAKSKNSITVMNVGTKHDSVLKHMLSRCKPNVKAVGLNNISQVNNHFIQNIDVTKKINGHFAFMTNFGTIADIIKLNEE